MTDKVQKILSKIQTRKLCTMDEHMAFYNDKAKEDYEFLCYIEEIIKASQEEPISEDLELASKKYACRFSSSKYGNDKVKDAFIAGADWQRHYEAKCREENNICCMQFDDIDAARVAAYEQGKMDMKEQFEKERLKHCDELTEEQAQIESEFVTNHLKKHSRTPTFIDAIEYGKRLQKAQLIAKAIDAHCFGFQGAALFSFRLPASNYLVGSEVKVIVIKKD